MLPEPIAVTLLVIEALEALDVPYLIGGSLASAVHGIARATLDTDLLADLRPEHAEPLTQALSDAFYVEPESIRDALRRRSSFNLIHVDTMFVGHSIATPPTTYHPQNRDRVTEFPSRGHHTPHQQGLHSLTRTTLGQSVVGKRAQTSQIYSFRGLFDAVSHKTGPVCRLRKPHLTSPRP